MDGPFGGLAYHREGFRQQSVQGLPLGIALLKFRRFRAQVGIRERRNGVFESIDLINDRVKFFKVALVLRAEYFLEEV